MRDTIAEKYRQTLRDWRHRRGPDLRCTYMDWIDAEGRLRTVEEVQDAAFFLQQQRKATRLARFIKAATEAAVCIAFAFCMIMLWGALS